MVEEAPSLPSPPAFDGNAGTELETFFSQQIRQGVRVHARVGIRRWGTHPRLLLKENGTMATLLSVVVGVGDLV